MNARSLLHRMAEQESRLLQSSFIAPVVRKAGVQVRLDGIVWHFRVLPESFEGWAVLKPLDHGVARVTGPASLAQTREYLDLFPVVPLIATETRDRGWWALPAECSDTRLRIEGLVPVLLPGDARLFDTLRTRWDGRRFWGDGRSPRRSPAVAAYLRESLEAECPVDTLEKRTLTAQERLAYEWQYQLRKERQGDQTEARLRAAVAHADGRFQSFIERPDAYTVTLLVDGESHTTTIRKDNLTVELAGICLSGEDQKFDLASLVGVIRQGRVLGES